MNKDIRPIGFAPLLYKKDKTYYLHGKPRHFSEEELNLNFWFFDEPINMNQSPEDDEILFFRRDVFELDDLLDEVTIELEKRLNILNEEGMDNYLSLNKHLTSNKIEEIKPIFIIINNLDILRKHNYNINNKLCQRMANIVKTNLLHQV